MNREEQAAAIEAILFVAGTGVELKVLAQALGITQLEISALADELIQKKDDARGLEFSRTDDLLQLRTKKKYAGYVRDALKPVARKTLSRSVLETLSIIAYKQPITRGEIEAIKGVSADYSLQTLLQRKLIQSAGRKQALGRPTLYRTTDEFLRHFGLSDLSQLPPLPEDVDLSDVLSEEESSTGETPPLQP